MGAQGWLLRLGSKREHCRRILFRTRFRHAGNLPLAVRSYPRDPPDSLNIVRSLRQFDTGRWLVPLLLLVGVLAPTACLLWFLNVAVNNQRDASRRKLAEAYRGQLILLRD